MLAWVHRNLMGHPQVRAQSRTEDEVYLHTLCRCGKRWRRRAR